MDTPTDEIKPPEVPDFILLHRSRPEWSIGAAILLAGLLCFLRWDAILRLSTHFIGGVEGDGGLYLWLVQSNGRDLFLLPWFNTMAFYPYGESLAWSDNFLLPSLLVNLLVLIGAPLELAWNLLILAANLLNGYCTYRLSYRLCGKYWPALIAGAGFMSFSFLTLHLGHPQLQFAFLLALLLSATFSWCAAPSLWRATLVGLVITASFLTTVYYAVFGALSVALMFIALRLLRPAHFSIRAYAKFLGGMLLGLLPCLPFLPPYLDALEAFGERHLYEAYAFAASGIGYLSSPELNWLYGGSHTWSHTEAQLFPGVVVLLLTLIAFFRVVEARALRNLARIFMLLLLCSCIATLPTLPQPWFQYLAALLSWGALLTLAVILRRLGKLEEKLGFTLLTNRAVLSILLFIATTALFISFGPLGSPAEGEYSPGIFTAFYHLFPGVAAARAISRIGIVVVLCLMLLSALAMSLILERRSLRQSWLILAALLIVAEHYTSYYPLEPRKPASTVFDFLQQLPLSNESMVVLPMTGEITPDLQVKSWGDYARKNVRYMLWSLPLRRPLVNGYSGQRSRMIWELPGQLASFPDTRSLQSLARIAGLRYVVYISEEDPTFSKEAFSKKIDAANLSLRFLFSDEQGNLLFEYIGSSRLNDDFALSVPPVPGGKVNLDLMPLYAKDAPEMLLNIFSNHKEHASAPIHAVTLKADGEPVTVSFEIPATSDRLRPIKLTFKISNGGALVLRRSRFDPP